MPETRAVAYVSGRRPEFRAFFFRSGSVSSFIGHEKRADSEIPRNALREAGSKRREKLLDQPSNIAFCNSSSGFTTSYSRTFGLARHRRSFSA